MNEAEEIGIAIAAIVAASLALQSALGPAMNSLVEAIKSAGLVQEGKGGLVSLGVGTSLAAPLGLSR